MRTREKLEVKHHGVKGMHWGVRKGSTDAHPPSEDHIRSQEAKQKIKSGGTKALTNKELEDYIRRLNLEKQYKTLVPSNLKIGLNIVKDIIGVGTTINQVMSFANSPSGKLIKDSLARN